MAPAAFEVSTLVEVKDEILGPVLRSELTVTVDTTAAGGNAALPAGQG